MEINIPKGYKKTDVGVIPQDWEVYYLYEITTKITDGEHATPQRTTEGYYLLSARNVQNGLIDLTDVDFVGLDEYQRIRKRCDPEANDILISCSGTIGRVAVLPSGIECVMVRSAALIKPNRTQTNSYFIQYILQSRVGQTQILQSLNQGVQANLFLNHIKRLKIPFPPLPEQRAIAQSLSDVDALIAALDQLITKKRNIKQGTMQQLLTGKRRLPGFSGEWKMKRVGDICDFIVPGRNKPRNFEGDIPWITTPDLKDGRSVSKSRLGLCISRDEAQNVGSKIVPAGSVIMSCAGELGIVALTKNEIVINQQLHAFIPSSIIDASFLMNAITAQKKYIDGVATKTAVPYLNKDNCNSIPIPLLSPPEQKAIAQVLSDMDAEIEALEQKRDKYKAIKQGMMQELLTGKTRLQWNSETKPEKNDTN